MCSGGGAAPQLTTVAQGPVNQAVSLPETFQRAGTVGGRTIALPGAGQDIPGITELAYGLMAAGVDLPEQRVAGFSSDQQAAAELARQGIGAWRPFLERGTELTEEGVGALQSARGETLSLADKIAGETSPGQVAAQEAARFGLETARAGVAGLRPDAALDYMSPFEEAVIQQTLADIDRQGKIAGMELRGQARQQGAYGGARQAVAEQELQRNILEQQARSLAQLRASGFESAADRAQRAAVSTAQVGAQGAQVAGDLGLQSSNLGLAGIQAGLGAQQQAAGLGQGVAGLGQQMVGLGQSQQQMNLQDVNTLSTIGAQQQRQAQAELDATYANRYQQQMQPYQQLAFASDIFTGAPSGQASVMSQPGPSIGSQLVGLGTAAYGLGQSGIFGGRT